MINAAMVFKKEKIADKIYYGELNYKLECDYYNKEILLISTTNQNYYTNLIKSILSFTIVKMNELGNDMNFELKKHINNYLNFLYILINNNNLINTTEEIFKNYYLANREKDFYELSSLIETGEINLPEELKDSLSKNYTCFNNFDITNNENKEQIEFSVQDYEDFITSNKMNIGFIFLKNKEFESYSEKQELNYLLNILKFVSEVCHDIKFSVNTNYCTGNIISNQSIPTEISNVLNKLLNGLSYLINCSSMAKNDFYYFDEIETKRCFEFCLCILERLPAYYNHCFR